MNSVDRARKQLKFEQDRRRYEELRNLMSEQEALELGPNLKSRWDAMNQEKENLERRLAGKFFPRKCGYCSKPFRTVTPEAKFCSDRCRVYSHRAARRASNGPV